MHICRGLYCVASYYTTLCFHFQNAVRKVFAIQNMLEMHGGIFYLLWGGKVLDPFVRFLSGICFKRCRVIFVKNTKVTLVIRSSNNPVRFDYRRHHSRTCFFFFPFFICLFILCNLHFNLACQCLWYQLKLSY